MRIGRVVAALGLSLVVCSHRADAGVQFFVNDPTGFDAATASLALLGSEDWSSPGNVDPSPVDEPMLPGVADGIFPHGVNPATGMTVQSNTLGDAATSPSPGNGLYWAPAGFLGLSGTPQPSAQLSSDHTGYSFDLIFARVDGKAPGAVRLSPMFYFTNGPSSTGTLAVQVYDDSDVLLGSTTVPNVADVSEASFLGVVMTEGSVLGRVNLWPGELDIAGADNIFVYAAAPEAGATAGACAALAALALTRRARAARRCGAAGPSPLRRARSVR